MNYEQKYKEALRKATQEYDSAKTEGTKNVIETIFPELAESEDEKIRKEIISYLSDKGTKSPFEQEERDCDRWISWLEKQELNNQNPSKDKPVSIHYDKNGEADGVRICSLDEDFVIKLHDEFDGKDVEWYEIGKKDIKTFNRKQAALISAYINEVNEALKEAGGDVLDVWYWTNESCEAYGGYAWCLNGNNGRLTYYSKYYACRVRGFLA